MMQSVIRVCDHAQSVPQHGRVSRRGSQRGPTAPSCGETRYSIILQSFFNSFLGAYILRPWFTFVTRVVCPEAFWGQMAPTLGMSDLVTCDALAAPGSLMGGGQWSHWGPQPQVWRG